MEWSMEGIFKEVDGQKFVGSLEIFDQQIEAAKNCFDVFVDNKSLGQSPILLGECQSGKTGSAVVLIKMFINWCEYRGINKEHREIYFSINSSNNDLLKQLDFRLLQSGLTDEVIHLHHAHYKKRKNHLSNDIKARLFIVDECHIALCSDDSRMKPYQDFLHECGITLGKNKKLWKNQNNFVLQISATPNSQVMLNEIVKDDEPFKFVYLQNSPLYLSVSHILNRNRVEQSYKLFCSAKEVKNKPSPWFKDRMKDFFDVTIAKAEYGVLILRTTGPQNVSNLKKFIKKDYPDLFEIRDYCARNKNISDISLEISTPLSKPLIAIVRGSLREGKTLESTKYIRMVIDSSDTVSSTVVQGLLGRCCGYPSNSHNRHDDNFKIYCDVEEIWDHVVMLEGLRKGESPYSIASSRYNTKSNNSKQYNYKISVLPLESFEAKNLIEERIKNHCDYAISDEFINKEKENHRRILLDGGKGCEKDLDTHLKFQIAKWQSVTAQRSNRKSNLIKLLCERFQNAHYDDDKDCYRVTSGAQVSSHLNYEVLDGCLPESNDLYVKLFENLEKKFGLDIDKHYAIFYHHDEYQDVTNAVTIDKMKKSILKDALEM